MKIQKKHHEILQTTNRAATQRRTQCTSPVIPMCCYCFCCCIKVFFWGQAYIFLRRFPCCFYTVPIFPAETGVRGRSWASALPGERQTWFWTKDWGYIKQCQYMLWHLCAVCSFSPFFFWTSKCRLSIWNSPISPAIPKRWHANGSANLEDILLEMLADFFPFHCWFLDSWSFSWHGSDQTRISISPDHTNSLVKCIGSIHVGIPLIALNMPMRWFPSLGPLVSSPHVAETKKFLFR